jgi:hypothetical protein
LANRQAARTNLTLARRTVTSLKQDVDKQIEILKRFQREGHTASTKKAQLERVNNARLAVEKAQAELNVANAKFVRARDFLEVLAIEEIFPP